ncbi:MAG: branched-chain amino acid transporter permease [Eubacteriales bacterium]|nr:branched-chain amino acid transporter permease [Eubacteriales bacterium]
MSLTEKIITIMMVVAGTMLTRFLPFAVFSGGRKTPQFIKYLGRVLPTAALAMLAVYCFKDVEIMSGAHAMPELIAVAVITLLHLWKRNLLLSISVGTVLYMVLVQMVF